MVEAGDLRRVGDRAPPDQRAFVRAIGALERVALLRVLRGGDEPLQCRGRDLGCVPMAGELGGAVDPDRVFGMVGERLAR